MSIELIKTGSTAIAGTFTTQGGVAITEAPALELKKQPLQLKKQEVKQIGIVTEGSLAEKLSALEEKDRVYKSCVEDFGGANQYCGIPTCGGSPADDEAFGDFYEKIDEIAENIDQAAGLLIDALNDFKELVKSFDVE